MLKLANLITFFCLVQVNLTAVSKAEGANSNPSYSVQNSQFQHPNFQLFENIIIGSNINPIQNATSIDYRLIISRFCKENYFSNYTISELVSLNPGNTFIAGQLLYFENNKMAITELQCSKDTNSDFCRWNQNPNSKGFYYFLDQVICHN